jgi:hypothetical protein
MVRHEGRLPLVMVQVYGVIPPVADSVTEYAEPTAPTNCVEVVATEGVAGTVMVTVAVLEVSDTEVAVTVTVCADEVAAGAVKVAAVVEVFDRVPPPLTLHVTPALFESLVTVADSVIASVPSTVAADAAMVTSTFPGPEQPVIDAKSKAQIATATIGETNVYKPRTLRRITNTSLCPKWRVGMGRHDRSRVLPHSPGFALPARGKTGTALEVLVRIAALSRLIGA